MTHLLSCRPPCSQNHQSCLRSGYSEKRAWIEVYPSRKNRYKTHNIHTRLSAGTLYAFVEPILLLLWLTALVCARLSWLLEVSLGVLGFKRRHGRVEGEVNIVVTLLAQAYLTKTISIAYPTMTVALTTNLWSVSREWIQMYPLSI